MNTFQMLSQMCHQVLSDADIKAICKVRGFSAQEAASRASFENFLLSDIGVAEALRALSQEELILLYLLNLQKKAVDISFFQNVYDPKPGRTWKHLTFNQRFQTTLKAVKKSLVRRGLLLIAEDPKAANAQTKLERERFRFPETFAKLLPYPFREAKVFDTPGDYNGSLVRARLLEIMGQKSATARLKGGPYRLNLSEGELRFGDRRFSVEMLQAWQKDEWAFDIKRLKTETILADRGDYLLGPIETVMVALSHLKPQEWASPKELSVWLKVFCLPEDRLDAESICRPGWQWGQLLKQDADKRSYYRPVGDSLLAESGLDPARYLHLGQDRQLTVNLHIIPYPNLEHLTRIADLNLTKSTLIVSPNLIKTGRTSEAVQAHPLTIWLQENVPAFKETMKIVKQRWGKQIVHQDLFIAKVKDLSLKVLLQKSITDPGRMIFLPNDFVAFPRKELQAVEKLVNKTGHVIKWVEAK